MFTDQIELSRVLPCSGPSEGLPVPVSVVPELTTDKTGICVESVNVGVDEKLPERSFLKLTF